MQLRVNIIYYNICNIREWRILLVTLTTINEENYEECLNLKVSVDNADFEILLRGLWLRLGFFMMIHAPLQFMPMM